VAQKTNANLVKFDTARLDLVGNSRSVSKGGDSPSDLVEGQDYVLGLCTAELGLRLVPEDDKGRGTFAPGLCNLLSGRLGDGRVDTAAETTVRADGDVEGLLARFVDLVGLRFFEDYRVGSPVSLGLTHGLLSFGKTSGRNHLHGLCNLCSDRARLEPQTHQKTHGTDTDFRCS
jgi:hypothetical protein